MSPARPTVLRFVALAAAVVLIGATTPTETTGAAARGAPAVATATVAGGASALRNLPTSLLVTLRPGVDPSAVDAAAMARGLVRVAWNPTIRTAQYVALGTSTVSAGKPSLAEATTRAGRVDGRVRVRLAGLAGEIGRLPGVAAAAPPVQFQVAADPTPTPVATPNDPYWSSQWGMDAIGARSAWGVTRGRPEILVAVIDTGVDTGHPDLAGRLVAGIDVGAGDYDPTDEHGHGTHVAGIVAAVAGNALGVAGVAPTVLVMPVKAMDSEGRIWDTAVAEGIAWAAGRGARVVNMSLGGDEASPTVNAAIDSARARGVVVVAAAGNGGTSVSYPGAYAPTIAVAAVEDRPASLDGDGDGDGDGCGVGPYGPGDIRHAAYSNTGPEVDLAAPGSCVASTYPTISGVSYASMTGTSMATPMVSAAAALVLSRNPTLTVDDVEAALLGTAADLGPTGPDDATGAGLLQVGAAVVAVPAVVSDGVAPIVRWSGAADGTLVRGTVSMSVAVADASPVIATRVYRDGRPMYVRRASGMPITWSSTGVPDGLHTWTAHGTDAGLKVGSASIRVLVANRRASTAISNTRPMTSTIRSITRSVTVAVRTPFVARFTGPSDSSLTLRLVDSRGRTVAERLGTGAAAIALASLGAGRYSLRATTTVARPGLVLRLAAAWFR